ncbi:MAG: hypothetical protein ABSH34_32215, partial [Verrucomicrobiota bacterium]
IRGKGSLIVLGFRVFRVFRGSRSQPSWIQFYEDEAKAEIAKLSSTGSALNTEATGASVSRNDRTA